MSVIPPPPKPKSVTPGLLSSPNVVTHKRPRHRFYYAQNASQPFQFGGKRIEFTRTENFAGTWRGVYVTESLPEINFLNVLCGRPTGIREITQAEYEQQSRRQFDAQSSRVEVVEDRSFYHSGDLGDIIYSLPTIERLGGGTLYIGPEIQLSRPTQTRQRMSPEIVEMIYDLLMEQDYIEAVKFAPHHPRVQHNLNLFREYCMTFQSGEYWKMPGFSGTKSLSEIHLVTFGLDRGDETKPWLKVDAPWAVDGKPIVIHRSHRYRNDLFPWKELLRKHGEQMVFTGLKAEHDDFVKNFGYVDFIWVDNLMELARVIAGARVYIGNQSCPYAIAEGLKKNTIQETWLVDPNCMFERPNAIFCKDGKVEIPEEWLA